MFDVEQFGDRLRIARIKKGLSQEELASLVGSTKQVVSKYENNQRTPKVTVANQYAEALGVPLHHLLDGEILDAPTPPGKENAPIQDEGIKFALFGDTEISDEVYEEVKRFAKFAQEQRKAKDDNA